MLGGADVEMEEGSPQVGGRPAKKVRHGELWPCLIVHHILDVRLGAHTAVTLVHQERGVRGRHSTMCKCAFLSPGWSFSTLCNFVCSSCLSRVINADFMGLDVLCFNGIESTAMQSGVQSTS